MHFLILFFPILAFAQGEAWVPEITVFGEARKSFDAVPTVSELSGTRLERAKKSTIGETLAREPGVASTQFGPNASRPVIRGLEGDRVRVLENGTGVLDASAASQDHAVAVDPLNVERIEIVRGPAALLYGSQAVGGVVNMVTSRICKQIPAATQGTWESRLGANDQARSTGASVNEGFGKNWAGHADFGLRASDDYHAPGYARTEALRLSEPLPAGETESTGRVYNSGNRTANGALGASYIGNQSYLGTSFSDYESTYGTVVERFTHINMWQQRWDLEGEYRDLGFVQSVRAKNSYSHYKHDEIENGQLGTSFKNEGDEGRVDFNHRAVAGYGGEFGLQANTFTFSAKGEESFIPTTHNSTYSIFLFENRLEGTLRPSFGFRLDQAQVKSDTDLNSAFGAGQTKNFGGGSASLGVLYQISVPLAFVVNAAYTERAPNYEELFANGKHAATGIFEVGRPSLKKERANSLEFSLRHQTTGAHGRLGIYVQDFANFIALAPTGAHDPDDLPIYDYTAVAARIYGAEFEYTYTLPAWIPAGVLELEFKADLLRGLNRATGENLPRLTPMRESINIVYKADAWQGDLGLERSEAQSRTAPFETPTAGYTFVNLEAEMPTKIWRTRASLFAKLHNAFNQEARNHVSVIKDVAPLPGRDLSAGLKISF